MTETLETSEAAAQSFLAAIGVQWQRRSLPQNAQLAALLAHERPDAAQQADIVRHVASVVDAECRQHGWHSMDLVVLHPQFPALDALLETFDRPHTHADDEVRLILDGAGLFGFFNASGQEQVLHVFPGDYLHIPAGVEHRFNLTAHKRIKALRLFADTAGWVAQYTARSAPSLAECAV